MSRPATLLVREVDFLMIYSHPIASDLPRGSKTASDQAKRLLRTALAVWGVRFPRGAAFSRPFGQNGGCSLDSPPGESAPLESAPARLALLTLTVA